MSNSTEFFALPYENASQGGSPATPTSGTSTRSLPQQDRAKVDFPPSHDEAGARALAALDADSEANYHPRTVKFNLVMLGLYLAVFVVALVSSVVLCSD